MTTSEQAYWLGFLATDGFIIHGGQGAGIQLAARDAAHLQKLADCLDSDVPVRIRLPRERGGSIAEVKFHSKKLARDLEPYGIVPAKSYTCVPWAAPTHLAAHYWRGAVDGDGHISSYISFCGTKAMVDGFLAFASDACGTRVKPYQRGAIWIMNIQGRGQIYAMMSVLYGSGGIALARKEARAADILAVRYQPRVRARCRICGDVADGRGLCGKHYQRWTSTGDPLTTRSGQIRDGRRRARVE